MKLQLGNLTFDADARQLFRGRQAIHLSPEAFELLRILIDARPLAVSKTDLRARLWPDAAAPDRDLASIVTEIREALGDSTQHPQFIRPAQRFGYAFSGDATLLGDGRPDAAGVAPGPVERRAPVGDPDATSRCWLILDGQRLPLVPGANILGRDLDSDGGIRLDGPTVSRRHACIFINGDVAVLEDLRSKNGTFLRGQPVTSAVPLADGDEIRIGSVVLQFRMVSGSRLPSDSGC